MKTGWLRNFRTGGYFCWVRQYPITCHVSRIIPVMCLISIEQYNEEGNSLVTDPSNNQVSFSRPDTNWLQGLQLIIELIIGFFLSQWSVMKIKIKYIRICHFWKFTDITWKFFLFIWQGSYPGILLIFTLYFCLDYHLTTKNKLLVAIAENGSVCLHRLPSIMAGFSNSNFSA